MNDIEITLRNILSNNIKLLIPIDEIDTISDLRIYGLNSLLFYRFIIEIEKKFNLEFGDEILDMQKYSSLKGLTDYLLTIKRIRHKS